jgi:hypothetical protein
MNKRVVLSGMIAGIGMLIINVVLSSAYTVFFPTLQREYENGYLFRSWSDPVMSIYFVHPILAGLFLAWIWDKTKSLFGGLKWWSGGYKFGLIYWLFSVMGMIMTYSSFQVSLLLVGSWTVSILIEGVLTGLLFAKLNPMKHDWR